MCGVVLVLVLVVGCVWVLVWVWVSVCVCVGGGGASGAQFPVACARRGYPPMHPSAGRCTSFQPAARRG